MCRARVLLPYNFIVLSVCQEYASVQGYVCACAGIVLNFLSFTCSAFNFENVFFFTINKLVKCY